MDATSLTGDGDPSYPHDSVIRQVREGKRNRRYTAERSIVCLVIFFIDHRMPSRPISSIVVGMKTHTQYLTFLMLVEGNLAIIKLLAKIICTCSRSIFCRG